MNILTEKNVFPRAYCINLDDEVINYKKILNEFNNILEIHRVSAIDAKLNNISGVIALYKTNIELFYDIINSDYNLPYLIVIEDDIYKHNNFTFYWPKIIKFINSDFNWDFISLDHFLNFENPKLNDYNDLFYKIDKSRMTGFMIYNMNFLRKNFDYLSNINFTLDMTMKHNEQFIQLIPKDLIVKQYVNKISYTCNENTKKYEEYYDSTEMYLQKYKDCIFTIVYKTYKNDLEWLNYSLLSLKKYLDTTNVFEFIIYTHDVVFTDVCNLMEKLNFINYRVIPVHYNYHGYVKQMQVKLDCYKDVQTKYVILLDSDLILQKPLNFNALIRMNGQIEWKYLRIEDDPDNKNFRVWKKACEDATKSPKTNHYMSNGFPFIFTTKSLENGAKKFEELHNVDYEDYCHNRCGHENIEIEENTTDIFDKLSKVFTEFEYIGYYCHNFSSDYIFTPTPYCLMDNQSNKSNNEEMYFIQNWSYGGINNEIFEKIHNILEK